MNVTQKVAGGIGGILGAAYVLSPQELGDPKLSLINKSGLGSAVGMAIGGVGFLAMNHFPGNKAAEAVCALGLGIGYGAALIGFPAMN